MRNDHAIDALYRHSLAARLSASKQQELFQMVQAETAKKDGLLFQQGDRYRGFFLITRGMVAVYRTALNGRRLVLHLMRSGDTFAEKPLFAQADKTTYPATARALTDCQVLCFPPEPFRAFLDATPELYPALLAIVAERTGRLADHLERVALYSVEQRLARYLVERTSPDVFASSRNAVRLDVPKAILAAHLGTVPETLSRTLRALEDRGLIHQPDGGARIHLTDPDALHVLIPGSSEA